jgi:hypothetical protein
MTANVWQPGQVALAVPKTLVVTLEKVLGDETIGMLVKFHQCVSLVPLHGPRG